MAKSKHDSAPYNPSCKRTAVKVYPYLECNADLELSVCNMPKWKRDIEAHPSEGARRSKRLRNIQPEGSEAQFIGVIPQPFRFLDLIPEMRNTVYKLVLSQNRPINVLTGVPRHLRGLNLKVACERDQPALTKVCRQIRYEATLFYYSLSTFDLGMPRNCARYWGASPLRRRDPEDKPRTVITCFRKAVEGSECMRFIRRVCLATRVMSFNRYWLKPLRIVAKVITVDADEEKGILPSTTLEVYCTRALTNAARDVLVQYLQLPRNPIGGSGVQRRYDGLDLVSLAEGVINGRGSIVVQNPYRRQGDQTYYPEGEYLIQSHTV
ncbi:hypothetical protein EJ08DRAFT_691803 [Tothia fuscella]|uniref:Uncharacterized protein n=1 Tax=Tothia fuscella TaxID=1048955 RepID=A0A9P4P1R3_9PEZI|nr:hypothetical protein EJ08DRAFT_691803 [Tothia fuscella]